MGKGFRILAVLCAVMVISAAAEGHEFAPRRVLVRFAEEATPDAIRQVEQSHSLVLVREISHLRVRVYKAGSNRSVSEVCRRLSALPMIEYAEPDYLRRPQQQLPTDPLFSQQWALHNTAQLVNGRGGPADVDIDWPEAMERYTPLEVVTVAVVDTGVAIDHPELILQTWTNSVEIAQEPASNGIDDDENGFIDDFFGWDFFDDDNFPLDENGHGTQVASTIAAEPQNGEGGSGVAPASLVMPLRVLDDFGRSSPGPSVSDLCEATTYASTNGARVINMSLGGARFSMTELLQMQWLDSQGVLVVAAAGNGGDDGIGDDNDSTPEYPASYDVDNIIAVAATSRNDQLAVFSNFGVSSVDLAAPGTDNHGADVARSSTYLERFESGAVDWIVDENCVVCSRWSLFVDAFFNTWLNDSQGFFGFPIDYSPDTDTWAMSPVLSIPPIGPQLRYRVWHDLEFFFDGMVVEASTDGVSWDLVDFVTGTSSTLPPGVGLPAGSVRRADLSSYAGQTARIRFRLLSDSSVQADGVYIDDVEINQVDVFRYDGTQYAFNNGTSFAAPLVAGVAAVLMSQRPELTHRQVRELVLRSVDRIPGLIGKVATGGRLNAANALEAAIASLCGDVDDDGVLTVEDVALYRRVLAGIDTFDLAAQSKCKAIASEDGCSIHDLVPLRRKIEGPDLPPGVAPVCSGAL